MQMLQTMTTPPPIISAQVGASFALLNIRSGAIVLTNDFGMRILSGLNSGLGHDQIGALIAENPEERAEATQAVSAVLRSWELSGLLALDTPDFPYPVAFLPNEDTPTQSFGGRGGTGNIACPDTVLAEQINTILGHMVPLPNQPQTDLAAQPVAEEFAVFKMGHALSGRISLDAARFVLIREMAEIVCGSQDVAAVFHAGCVEKDGDALMICGDSGQGKSTLTFGMVAAGCTYLGDDHIPLFRDGRCAMSFPTAAGVKPGSWDLPEIRELQAKHGLTLLSPRQGVRYIPLHHAKAPVAGTKRPVRALIFPHFHPEAQFEMTRLSPEQALFLALQAGSRLSNSHKSDLAPLCNFFNDVPAFALRYSSSEQSVSACLTLLSSPET